MVAILQGAFHVNRFVECKAGAVAFTAKIANYTDSKSNLSTADIFNFNTWRRIAVKKLSDKPQVIANVCIKLKNYKLRKF